MTKVVDARLVTCTILSANSSVATELPKRLLNRRYRQSITRAPRKERRVRHQRVASLATTFRKSCHPFVQVIAKLNDSGLVELSFLNDKLPGDQINVPHRQCQGFADSQSGSVEQQQKSSKCMWLQKNVGSPI